MSTNSGEKDPNEKENWKEWITYYMCKTALTEILSVSDAVAKGFRVLFDSNKENCCYVVDKKNGSVIRFPYHKQLYVKDDSDPQVDCSFATSVEGFTQREMERARQAWNFYHDLNAENIENVKFFITSNREKNVPISSEDMELASKVFGMDVPNCKGKSAQKQPPVIERSDIIKLPPELCIEGREVDLAIDIVFINSEFFLHAQDGTIKCPRCVVLLIYKKGEAYNKESLYGRINNILRKYNQGCVRIHNIHVDNKFRPIMTDLIDTRDVDFNFSNPGDHVPDSKRENRTLQ